MNEALSENPWTDEVCKDWLEITLDKARTSGLSTNEITRLLNETMTQTVHEYIKRRIEEILNMLSISYDDLDGVAIYKGPGSFTGLRIGMSVANALAYAQNIPIVARGGEDWVKQSIDDLQKNRSDKIALPEYGAPARTTTPRK
jgi:tRNA threonylcarbamoyladenosine biosynthesis protein TsaB